MVSDSGVVARVLKPKIRRGKVSRHARLELAGGPDGKRETKWVHRMVLEAFVGPAPPGTEACHENDDGLDNRLENLRWDTRAGNRRDAARNRPPRGRAREVTLAAKICRCGHAYGEHNPVCGCGCGKAYPAKISGARRRRGEDHRDAKLTTEDVRAIRRCGSDVSDRTLAKIYGVGRSTIRLVRSGRTWKEVRP